MEKTIEEKYMSLAETLDELLDEFTTRIKKHLFRARVFKILIIVLSFFLAIATGFKLQPYGINLAFILTALLTTTGGLAEVFRFEDKANLDRSLKQKLVPVYLELLVSLDDGQMNQEHYDKMKSIFLKENSEYQLRGTSSINNKIEKEQSDKR